MIKYYGCHVSCAGGYENAASAANVLGVNSIQIHPSAPQRWNFKPFDFGVEDKFNEIRKGIEKVFFHGIYLINLASPEDDKRKRSILSLRHYLDLAERMNAEGVIFHLGSLKDEPDEELGFKRITDSVLEILEKAKGSRPLLLEVSAGAGRVVGAKLEDLARVYELTGKHERIKFALDTQHMWASGYDWKERDILSEVDIILGLNNVACIHLNDSKSALGSKVDRHENLGVGLIGEEAIKKILRDPRVENIPFVLETPAMKDIESAKVEVERFKEMIG
jgi:deoxyribonuclease-4